MSTTRHKYKKINSILNKIFLNMENFNIKNKNKDIFIKNRILQIISIDVIQNYNKKLIFDNFFINKAYKVELRKLYKYKIFFNYFLKSIFLCFVALVTLLKKKNKSKLNILQIDGIKNKKIYNYLLAFLKENKKIFKNEKYYIIGGINPYLTNKDSKYMIIRKNFLLFLISNHLNFNEKVKLIFSLTKNIFIQFNLIWNKSLNVLVIEDYLYLTVIKNIDLKNFIVTSNRVQTTPLWLNFSFNKKFKTKMLWLGETALNLPRIFKNKTYFKSEEDYIPFYKFINVDQHIVWNNKFKDFLESKFLIRQTITNHNKPLILAPLKKYKIQRKNLFIFDNNPKELGFNGVAENYVSFQNIKKYLDDICEEFNDISKKNSYIFIKRKKYLLKKDQSPLQKQYLNNFDELIKKHKNIKLIDERDEYLKYLNSSKLCINFPFSSSASVSEYYKIQTLFYDPTGNLSNNYYKKKIPLISTRRNLNTILLGLFNKN